MKLANRAIALSTLFSASLLFSTHSLARDLPVGTVEVFGGSDLSFSTLDNTSSSNGDSRDDDVDDTTIELATIYYTATNVGFGLVWEYEQYSMDNEFFSITENSNAIGPMIIFNQSLGDVDSGKLFFSYQKIAIDSKYSETFLSEKTDFEGALISVGGIYSHFLNNNVSLNLRLAYNRRDIDDKTTGSDFKTDSKGFDTGLSLSAYF